MTVPTFKAAVEAALRSGDQIVDARAKIAHVLSDLGSAISETTLNRVELLAVPTHMYEAIPVVELFNSWAAGLLPAATTAEKQLAADDVQTLLLVSREARKEFVFAQTVLSMSGFPVVLKSDGVEVACDDPTELSAELERVLRTSRVALIFSRLMQTETKV